MADFDDAPLSTVIDTDASPTAVGGGAPASLSEPADPAAPPSLRETLETVFKEGEDPAKVEAPAEKTDAPKPDAKTDEKPAKAPDGEKVEPKPRDPAGKFAAKDGGEESAPEADKADKTGEGEADKQNDGRRHVEVPRNFLPKAKELWRNTPAIVQQEIERITHDHETELQQHREATERYAAVKDYDDLARSNGRDLRQSLARVVEIETALAKNPIAGLNRILQEVGPRKPDGQPFSLYEVAAHIVQSGPQGYQQMVAQAQQAPQQRQADPEVASLKEELASVKSQMTATQIIEPFARENPRYYELQDDIAFFLQSGRIPASLSPNDRLAAAYDMAERINPPSHVSPTANDQGLDPQTTRRADDGFSGSKSIKSAPGSVSDDAEAEAKGDESIRDSLLKTMRRLNRS